MFLAGGQAETTESAAVRTEALGDEIAELAAQIAAATCRWLELVAEFDRRRGHELFGMHSCAVWLAWRCALTPRAAQEHVRVARTLEGIPKIHAAFARGRLTYSKVRALSRVACSQNEELLLEHSRHATAAQLERICSRYRGTTLREAGRAHELRHFSHSWDPSDGSLGFSGRLAPEEGALFLKALELGFEALRSREEGDERPSKADALVALAQAALAAGAASSSSADRHQLVVHVDAATLAAEGGSDGACTIEGGPAISDETARRLGCDASLVAIVERDGEPLSVGRRTRTVPPALRRAVHARDETCRYPGCENRLFTDLHHIEPWALGGETSRENLIRLCTRHHRRCHEGGFTVEALGGDRFRFRRPDGRVVPECPPLRCDGPDQIRRQNRRRGLVIGPQTCDSLGRGERFDLDLTIEGLCAAAPAGGPRGP